LSVSAFSSPQSYYYTNGHNNNKSKDYLSRPKKLDKIKIQNDDQIKRRVQQSQRTIGHGLYAYRLWDKIRGDTSNRMKDFDLNDELKV
jgi:hypothetical protein